MELDRGSEGRGLSSLFYTFRNTINIYTEDEDKDLKFYGRLFKRLLQGTGIVINDIHPLGSCKDVIEHCQNDTDTTMPKLYIIDGDIFLMTTPRPPIDHLYVLDAYCMENKVIEENAYYEALDFLDPIHEVDKIKEKAEYNAMMDAAEAPFIKLHCHMAVCKEKVDRHYLKSAKSVMSNGSISSSKVDKLCDEIKNDIVRYGGIQKSDVDSAIISKMAEYPPSRSNLMKYVSGKDYLIVYIDEYTRTRLKAMSGQSKEFWKFQFGRHCDLTPLNGLKTAIVNEVNNFNSALQPA